MSRSASISPFNRIVSDAPLDSTAARIHHCCKQGYHTQETTGYSRGSQGNIQNERNSRSLHGVSPSFPCVVYPMKVSTDSRLTQTSVRDTSGTALYFLEYDGMRHLLGRNRLGEQGPTPSWLPIHPSVVPFFCGSLAGVRSIPL